MEAIPAKGTKVKQLHVELFPAPVELACPAGITGPLCDRKQALIDLACEPAKRARSSRRASTFFAVKTLSNRFPRSRLGATK